MKKISTIFLLVITASFFAGGIKIQAQDLINFNGWEFLSWKMKKNEIEKILKERKTELAKTSESYTYFKYKGMNTWLNYDINNCLNKVEQRKTFSIIEYEKSKEFFEKTIARLTKTYGKPSYQKINKQDSVQNYIWELTHTKINLEYNYMYKIIDEFGAGSYWIEININPNIFETKITNNFIKIGTEFEKADNLLVKYGAKRNVFSRKFAKPSVSYLLLNNVGIIIIYDKDVIVGLLKCNNPEVEKDIREWKNIKQFELYSNNKILDNDILNKTKPFVPVGWTAIGDSTNTILITKVDSARICNFINTDKMLNDNYEEFIKTKIIGKIQYQLKYTLKKALTDDDIKSIKNLNDSVSKIIKKLPEKYNIAHLSRKYDDFIPDNEKDKQNIEKFKKGKKEIMKLYKKLPDFNTEKYSIYVSDNMPWYAIFCSKETEGKVYKLKNDIENIIN